MSGIWRRFATRSSFINADIRDAAAIAPLIRGADTVFHLAAIPSVPRSIDDPVPSHQVNIDGTFNVFRAAAQGGVRRIVYAASSSAYGDTPTLPKTESMTPQPEIALRGAETDGRILRLGVPFLLRHRDRVAAILQRVWSAPGSVQPVFRRAEPVHEASAGAHRRPRFSATASRPAISLTWRTWRSCATRRRTRRVCAGKMYNAGNGGRYSLNFIWDLLQKIEGVKIAPKYGPPRAGDVRDSMADTAAAKAELGHAPRFSIEEGLKRTLEWYRQTK